MMTVTSLPAARPRVLAESRVMDDTMVLPPPMSTVTWAVTTPSFTSTPKGRNQYGWAMENKRADVFLTYRTNAVLAKRCRALQIVAVPDALSVGADYGITLIAGASKAAALFADYILGSDGQKVLARFGFDAPE